MKYAVCLVMAAVVACSSPSKKKLKDETDRLIRKSNQALLQGNEDRKLIDSAFESVESFVAAYPDDTLTPAYLFEKALLQEKQRQYDQTLVTLERIYTSYPHSAQSSKALFLQGYLYANVLGDYDKARIKYQLYLDNYSDVDPKITRDVQMELKNLGKTPDEILKEILEKSNADTTQVPV